MTKINMKGVHNGHEQIPESSDKDLSFSSSIGSSLV